MGRNKFKQGLKQNCEYACTVLFFQICEFEQAVYIKATFTRLVNQQFETPDARHIQGPVKDGTIHERNTE